MRRPLLAALTILFAVLAGAPTALGAAGTLTHYPIPITTTPYGMTTGPDGKIWIVDSGNHTGGTFIGRMSTSGAMTAADLVALPTPDLGLAATTGPDGNMWVLQDNHVDKVPAAVTQTSEITSYALSAGTGGFGSIAAGPDGRLWYGFNHRVGTITTDGTIGSYPTSSTSSIAGVIAGPDGKMWFGMGDTIARMSTAGVVAPGDEFPLPPGNSSVFALTAGPDGNVWFTIAAPAAVGRITPAGTFTIFPTPTASSLPFGITPGPDGLLWFVERNGDNVGSIPTTATSGADITEYPVGGTNIGLEYITAGPDKRMWFNENLPDKVGAITTNAAAATVPPETTPTIPPVLTPTLPGVTPTAPAPTPLSATKAFSLPSAKACISRRSFAIRIRKLPGVTFVSAVVKVNGKRVQTVTRARITAPVNLKGLPKGRVTVSITATATDGRTVTGTRVYRTCTIKRRSRGPGL